MGATVFARPAPRFYSAVYILRTEHPISRLGFVRGSFESHVHTLACHFDQRTYHPFALSLRQGPAWTWNSVWLIVRNREEH